MVDELIAGKISLSGAFGNSKLITRLQYFDSFMSPYLDLSAQIINTEKSTLIHFLPEPLIFSYDNWEIMPGNEVEINPGFIKAQDFVLNSLGQQISITSFPDSVCPGQPFRIRAIPLNAGNPIFNWYRDSVLIPYTPAGNPALTPDLANFDPWALQTTLPTNADSLNIYLILNSRLSCSSRPQDTTAAITIYRKRADDPSCLLVNSNPKVFLKPSISYYPNPTDNELNLLFSGFSKKDVQIQIFDQMGRDVKHLTTYTDQRSTDKINMNFDVRQLKAGLYLIKAGNAEYQKVLRFIKR